MAPGSQAFASESSERPDEAVTVAQAALPSLVVTQESRPDPVDGLAMTSQQVAASWFPTPRSPLGFMAAVRPAAAGTPDRPGLQRPGLDLGLHWRSAGHGRRGLQVQAWQTLAPDPDAWTLVQSRQPAYGARVEMRLKPARAGGLVADYQFFGLQLQSGARITIRRTEGRPRIYYRVQFYAL
ncbi:hypothetical protein [Ramlibacter tataouinensis]|nr:hypothetical protein [Ramlibacter tataouinensis]